MSKDRTRYKKMERYITLSISVALLFFIIFLISSGFGITWLKVLCSIVSILICSLCLIVLGLSKELLNPRSIWMSTCTAAIIICIVFSLLLNYPSPNPYARNDETTQKAAATDPI